MFYLRKFIMNIEKQKAKLIAQVDTLESRISNNQSILGQKREGTSEDDVASLYEMQATAHSAIQIDKRLLAETRAALIRIDAGDYEFCASCDEEINPKRLEANPVAKLCIECADVADIKKRQYA